MTQKDVCASVGREHRSQGQIAACFGAYLTITARYLAAKLILTGPGNLIYQWGSGIERE